MAAPAMPGWQTGRAVVASSVDAVETKGASGMVQQFLLNVISAVQAWLGTASVLFLLWGGYLLWTSGDNPSQRSHAWRHLAAVVGGLVVVVFAQDLVRLVYSWAGQGSPF